MTGKVTGDPAWMRQTAAEIERAADDADRGNADVQWLLASDLTSAERAKVSAAYRSSRSAPEALRGISRGLRLRAQLYERADELTSSSWVNASRISVPKWLRKRALKIAKKVIKITGLVSAFVEQANDYAFLLNKAKNEVFWGNFCGNGNKGAEKAPADTLDACCKAHDAAYVKLGLSAAGQLAPDALMAAADANRALANCASRQPDGTEAGTTKRFDPNRIEGGIQGDDARSGVMKLFGLMADIGFALRSAKAKIASQIDKIPFVSTAAAQQAAEWALRTAAKEILDLYRDQLDDLGVLV